jgi:hypothetical protein
MKKTRLLFFLISLFIHLESKAQAPFRAVLLEHFQDILVLFALLLIPLRKR